MPSISRRDYLNSGGVGDVFRDPRRPDWCVKRFHRPVTGDSAANLLRLSSVFASLRPSSVDFVRARFSWPIELFGAPDRLVGFAMPLAPQAAFFKLRVAGKETNQLLQAKFLMDQNYWRSAAVQSSQPALTQDMRLLLCIDALESIRTLSTEGMAYGDISGNNICVNLDTHPTVFFLDADSIEFDDSAQSLGVATVDWNSPITNDRLRRSRSLIALFAWRLLTEVPTNYPTDPLQKPARISERAATAIARCYQSGEDADLSESIASIRLCLSSDVRRDVIEQSLKSGFARRVLTNLESPRDAWESAISASATNHLQLEDRIESATATRRRLLIQSHLNSPQTFLLDLRPGAYRLDAPRSEDELLELALEARFTEIANFFSSGDLAILDASTITARCVGHALSVTGSVALSTEVKIGEALVRWDWPKSKYVNFAEVTAQGSVGTPVVQRIRRGQETSASYLIKLAAGGPLAISVRLGAASSNGRLITNETPTELTIQVPAPPPPVGGSRVTSHNSLSTTPVFDIDAADLLSEATAADTKRKKRRKRIILGCALFSLICGTVIGVVIATASHQSEFDALCRKPHQFVPTRPLLAC